MFNALSYRAGAASAETALRWDKALMDTLELLFWGCRPGGRRPAPAATAGGDGFLHAMVREKGPTIVLFGYWLGWGV